MTWKFIAAVAALLVLTLLVQILRDMVLTPVRAGKNTTQLLCLAVTGCEPALEQNVAGLLWLNDCGVLRCRIIILGNGLDAETRFVARTLERDHGCITFIENGEQPEWIRTTSF